MTNQKRSAPTKQGNSDSYRSTVLIGIFFGALIVSLIIIFNAIYLIDHFTSKGSRESNKSGDDGRSYHNKVGGANHSGRSRSKSSSNEKSKVPKSQLQSVVTDQPKSGHPAEIWSLSRNLVTHHQPATHHQLVKDTR